MEVSDPTGAARTLLTEAEDPATDPARLAELATSAEEHVRRRALLNPACPNEVREASGMLFLFAVERADFVNGMTSMMVTRSDFTRDLASPWYGVLVFGGDAEDYEVFCAAEIINGDGYEPHANNETSLLVSCGSGAPDWWSDWSRMEDFLGRDAVAALARGDDSLLAYDAPKAAKRAAFIGYETTATAWGQIRKDLATVFATGERSEWGSEETVPSRMSSSQELSEIADRWLREESWRELSATAHRAVLSALARHPNTPTAVLQELAVSDQESVRWLVTRNPSATDEIRAAAVLAGVDNDTFTEELPNENWTYVQFKGVHVAVHASAWTREEFAERFPEVFHNPDGDWVRSDGQVAIQAASATAAGMIAGAYSEIPDEIRNFLWDEIGRSLDMDTGSVTEIEN